MAREFFHRDFLPHGRSTSKVEEQGTTKSGFQKAGLSQTAEKQLWEFLTLTKLLCHATTPTPALSLALHFTFQIAHCRPDLRCLRAPGDWSYTCRAWCRTKAQTRVAKAQRLGQAPSHAFDKYENKFFLILSIFSPRPSARSAGVKISHCSGLHISPCDFQIPQAKCCFQLRITAQTSQLCNTLNYFKTIFSHPVSLLRILLQHTNITIIAKEQSFTRKYKWKMKCIQILWNLPKGMNSWVEEALPPYPPFKVEKERGRHNILH